jgi:hypothetical protein
MIGTIRFSMESLEVNHFVAQRKTGTNRVCQDLSAAKRLVAGPSPAPYGRLYELVSSIGRPVTTCASPGES